MAGFSARDSLLSDDANSAFGSVRKALTTPLPIFGETKPNPMGFMGAYDRQSGKRIVTNEADVSPNAAYAPTVAANSLSGRFGREGQSLVRGIDNGLMGAQGGGASTATGLSAAQGVRTGPVQAAAEAVPKPIRPVDTLAQTNFASNGVPGMQRDIYSHIGGNVQPAFRGQDTDRVAAHITYDQNGKKTIRMDGRVGANNALVIGGEDKSKMVPGGYNPNPAQKGLAAGQGGAMAQYMEMARQLYPDAAPVQGVTGVGGNYDGLINAIRSKKVGEQRAAAAMQFMQMDATKAAQKRTMDIQDKQMYDKQFSDNMGILADVSGLDGDQLVALKKHIAVNFGKEFGSLDRATLLQKIPEYLSSMAETEAANATRLNGQASANRVTFDPTKPQRDATWEDVVWRNKTGAGPSYPGLSSVDANGIQSEYGVNDYLSDQIGGLFGGQKTQIITDTQGRKHIASQFRDAAQTVDNPYKGGDLRRFIAEGKYPSEKKDK